MVEEQVSDVELGEGSKGGVCWQQVGEMTATPFPGTGPRNAHKIIFHSYWVRSALLASATFISTNLMHYMSSSIRDALK